MKMKKTLSAIISTSTVAVLAFSAVAQDAPTHKSDQRVNSNDRLINESENQTDRQGDYSERQGDRTDRPGDRTDRSSDRDRNHKLNARQAEHIQGVAKASDLIGMNIKNNQDENVGEVTDLALDVESGRIVAIIISSGGFLGMGDELSAVPPNALRFNAERDTLQLDVSKEKLSSAPHFKADQWPDFGQPEYASGVYSAYEVEPYFSTDANTEVNNSARNERDRNDATLTPFDQGNSKADVATTAQIRKEINASENMSVSGKNVKIITKDGQVTLRGPVDNEEEKQLIGEIANRLARSGNVDNQLEVKSTTSSSSSNY